jgi:DNA primase
MPDLQRYKCFSCGEGGDVFKFIQKKENLDFIEALEFLAKRAGIVFERKGVSPERASERDRMLELNALAVRFFQDRLSKSEDAKAYLAGRGILKETQEKFDIGYAPPDWEALTFYLQQKRADLALAEKIGLIKARQEGGGYYDAFRNRLMFPIHDVSGRVIAFGGRALDDDPAKYLNSPQSPLFDKSRTLYGLVFARKKLSGDIPAVFVEGYVDVVTTHQAGFTQCVATLGTSMTEEHARMLARYNPRVVICYDGDAAGIKATLRGATVWESIGVDGAEVRVARLPAGDDPDSLLRRGETAAFQAALDKAVPRVDFQIELVLKEHNLKSEDGRDAALAEVIPILASLHSKAARAHYAQDLVKLHPLHARLGIGRAMEQLLADVEAYARQSRDGQGPRDRNYPLTEQANRAPLAEQPPPPVFRPPDRKQWGGEQWPGTRNVIRKGEGRPEGNGGYGNKGKRRYPDNPIGDPTPPSLDAPLLTGAEKAERQLLRACFSAEWRPFILSRLKPEVLLTPQGRRLFAWIAATPAAEDGSLDPLPLLHRAEREEEDTEADEAGEDFYHRGHRGTPREEAGDTALEAAGSGWEGEKETEATPENVARGILPGKGEKLSDFLRAVLEDSPFLVSNERLNEAAVSDCIRRLQKDHQDRSRRELAERLQHAESLPPEQRRAYIEQYHRNVRETRGSPPVEDDG